MSLKSAIRVSINSDRYNVVEPTNEIIEALELSKMIDCNGSVVDFKTDSGYTEFTYIANRIIPIELIVSIFKHFGEFSLIWASSNCESRPASSEYVEMANRHIVGNYSEECCGFYYYDCEGGIEMGIGTEPNAIRELSVCSWYWLEGRKPKQTDKFVLKNCKNREAFLKDNPNGDYDTYFEEHLTYPDVDAVIEDIMKIQG